MLGYHWVLMFRGVQRRQVVRQIVEAALGCTFLSLGGCGARRPSSATSNGAADWTSRIADLEKSIPRLMDENKVPGLSLALIKNAKLWWTRSFGVKDRASGAPVEGSTVFEAGSMSKPVFAYVVMKLCEVGVLHLDTPLVKYTHERFLTGDPRLEAVTARHILSHTAGFQNARSGERPLKVHFTPGEQWMYSGEGYFYLQSVISALTGRVSANECSRFEADLEVCATDFDAFMTSNLLAPFGMRESGYLWTEMVAGQVARPHDALGNPLPYRKPTAAAVARYGAMGGLLTTAADYARFLIEVLDPKPQDRVRLSRASLTEMLRPHVKVEDGKEYSIWWALGWRVAQLRNQRLVSHGGDQAGFHSTAEISPARKAGYVLLTNGDLGWKLIKDLAPDIAQWIHA